MWCRRRLQKPRLIPAPDHVASESGCSARAKPGAELCPGHAAPPSSVKRVLLTGMSGTGKSTVIAELAGRGYKAVDIDQPGWSETAPDGEWVWREGRVQTLLSTEDAQMLFVSGCASNQVKFYPQFDEIILLSAPADVIVHRLATRTTNSFGKSPEELAKVLGDLAHTEPLLRRRAGFEIDTTAPLADVVTAVLRLTGADPPR
jgi:shikimate kinase